MRMDNTLSSRISRVGDKFTATVALPVHINGRIAIPAGSIIEGRVTQVTQAKRKSKPGTLAVEFDELIFPDGLRLKVDGFLTADDPDMQEKIDDENRVSGSNKDRTGVFVGGGGAVGAVLGGILGGVEGILLGGVIGAGAGIAGILLSKGEEARVPAGTPFGIQLRQPLIIRSQDIAQNPNRAGIDPDPASDPDPADYRSAPPSTRRSDQPELKSPESRPGREPESSRPNRGIESPPTREPERNEPVEPEPEPNEPEVAEAETTPAEPLPLSSPEMIRRAQEALRDEGYYEGDIDGNVTPRMSAALKTYQKENGLPETGNLDPETAKKLGILGTPAAARPQKGRSPVPASDTRTSRPVADGTTLARVLSAKATRRPDGSIDVSIETQANTGGWRWFGESVINGDTLEVYARATRPTGPSTQVITRGRIDLNVKEGVEHVRRIVVHGEGGDVNLPLASGNNSASRPAATPAGSNAGTRVNTNINRQAEELLTNYQRIVGYRSDGTSVSIDNRQYGEPELELLFALDSFVNSSRLYSRMVGSLQDQTRLRAATLSLAREARRADKVITTTSSRTVPQIEGRWDAIRQEVLRLMQIYGITTDEIEG